MTITLAMPAIYGAVDTLVRDAYAHDYGPRDGSIDELSHCRVRAERHEVWVAVDDSTGDLLGSITTSRERGPRLMSDVGEDELDFRLLAVSPAARRRGIGAHLTRHVVDLARQRGYRQVFLKSAPNMAAAHRLYKSLGFRRDPDRDGLFIGGVKQCDLHAFVLPVFGEESNPVAATKVHFT